MAKVTILIFFVIGVAALLVIRYAIIGFRAANRYVDNSLKNSNQTADHQYLFGVADKIIAVLMVQKTLLQHRLEDGGGSFEQDASLLYVLGFVDGSLRVADISDSADVVAVGSIVFNSVFGEGNGTNLLRKAILLDKMGLEKNTNAVSDGIREATAFFSGQKDAYPHKWSEYIYK